MNTISFHGETDVGRTRERNEDHYQIDESSDLFLVADGVASCPAGHVASRMVCDGTAAFIRSFHRYDLESAVDCGCVHDQYEHVLATAVRIANKMVFRASRRREGWDGMATTFVGMKFLPGRCVVAHVGDSRAYRLRGNELEQLTEDHSLIAELQKLGVVDGDPERVPFRHVISRSVGIKEEVDVEVAAHGVRPDDLFILCTDGLTDQVPESLIRAIAIEHQFEPSTLTGELVDAANEAGGKDNVTVIAVRIPPGSLLL